MFVHVVTLLITCTVKGNLQHVQERLLLRVYILVDVERVAILVIHTTLYIYLSIKIWDSYLLHRVACELQHYCQREYIS